MMCLCTQFLELQLASILDALRCRLYYFCVKTCALCLHLLSHSKGFCPKLKLMVVELFSAPRALEVPYTMPHSRSSRYLCCRVPAQRTNSIHINVTGMDVYFVHKIEKRGHCYTIFNMMVVWDVFLHDFMQTNKKLIPWILKTFSNTLRTYY